MLSERQQAFREFDRGVFNILKLAIEHDVDARLCSEIERDIKVTIPPAARREMLRYTDAIEVNVYGRQWSTGWPFCKKTTHKHLTADVIFNPYKASLSVWTDPNEPGGIVCFQ
jgi:hypothetical protein